MSETTKFNPTEEPSSGSERFQDTDPLEKKISHIRETLLHLADRDKQTEYRREYEVFLNSGITEPYGPISVSAETTNTPDNLDGSNLRIILPPEIHKRENGGLFKWETTLTFEKEGDKIEARVMLDPSMSPKEAFARILERDDLPQELATIFIEMASTLVDKPSYDASGMNIALPITEEQYERYWQEVHTAMDTREEPAPMTIKWDTNSWHDPNSNEPPSIPLSNGEILIGASLEAVKQADTVTITSGSVNTKNFYFFFSPDEPGELDDTEDDDNEKSEVRDENKQGTLYAGNVYIFQEFITDTLPELTAEERKHNPFMIIPAAMNTITSPGKNPGHIPASPDYTAAADAADDFGPAQKHAEFLYKKKLAIERSSFAFNPARAERVTETLEAVMGILKKKYPDNPEGTQQ